VFPLKVKIVDGNVYVLDNLGYESVPNFCSITEINGVPAITLLEKSCKLYNTSLDHAKYLMFEESFPLLLANYLGIHPPWVVKFKMKSKVQTVKLKVMTSKAYYKQKKPHSNRYRSYSISVNDVKIPVLDLPGFSHGTAKDWESFIDTFFLMHKSSRYLAIDLRQNRGGSGYWGFYLLDYLTDTAYRIANKFEFKVSEIMRESVYASKAGNQLNQVKNGEYLEVVNHKMRSPHTTLNKFKGKAFLLISENTFSAGVVFAAVFKANKLGVVIGQETSGRICFGSDPVTITLRNSKLTGSIPLAIYTLPGENPDRGVIPDIKVSRSIDDYQPGQDKELEKVKELIKEDLSRS
jgi:C-terminal processing protease CtpA/Prc